MENVRRNSMLRPAPETNGRYLDTTSSETDHEAVVRNLARRLFDLSYRQGRWDGPWSRIHGRATRLHDLRSDAAKSAIGMRHFVGTHQVPLRQICGSENRPDDYDAAFRPRFMRDRNRWIAVATARLEGRKLPPVDLIQIGDSYFVRDGHNRVSVARALGDTEIAARVTLWSTRERSADCTGPSTN